MTIMIDHKLYREIKLASEFNPDLDLISLIYFVTEWKFPTREIKYHHFTKTRNNRYTHKLTNDDIYTAFKDYNEFKTREKWNKKKI